MASPVIYEPVSRAQLLAISHRLHITVRDMPNKGRGVVALKNFKTGDIIETAPVFVIDAENYQKTHDMPYINHTFVWEDVDGSKTGVIAFGFCSMCNHSESPNANIVRQYEDKLISLVALEDIGIGEEITFQYKTTKFEVFD